VNDPLATVSSDAGTGLKLARGAALRFWLAFILGGTVVGVAVIAALGRCGGPEWGGCLGGFVIVSMGVASTALGVVAALSHGVAVFLLRRTFGVMINSHRVASSGLTALTVLVIGYFVLTLGPPEEAGWRLLLLIVALPFLLSILVVPVVSRLRGALLVLLVLVGPSFLAGQADTTRAAPRLFQIRVNQQVGYIDATGRTIITPRFEEAGDFTEGLAPALVEGKWGYIDATGTFVIAPRFTWASDFSQGLAAVSVEGKWGYIDRTGAWVVQPQFFASGHFSEGLGLVATACRRDPGYDPRQFCYPDKHGYIDRTGRFVIQPRFRMAYDFAQGFAAVEVGNKTGFIDTTGALVIGAKWNTGFHPKFADGRAAVQIGDKWGYIDRTGRVVIQPLSPTAVDFAEQLTLVVVDHKWGFIDTTGAIAIVPQFYLAMPFSEGLAAVQVSPGMWGYIDRSGRIVIEPRQRIFASPFAGGLARVVEQDGSRYIDRTGNIVWAESLRTAVAQRPRPPPAPPAADTTPLGGTGSLVDRVAAAVDRAESAEAGRPVDRAVEVIMQDVAKATTQLATYLESQPNDVRALILSVRLGRFRQVTEPIVTKGGDSLPTFASLAAEYAVHHAALNRALALEPNNAEVHYWKARLFGLSHDWMGMLYGLTPPPAAERTLAGAYADSAIRFGRRAVELAPDRVPYREALAIYLILSEQEREAAAVLREVAGGHHPMATLLADWQAIPVPAGAVALSAEARGMARMWMEEGTIPDYPFLRVRMYVVMMPADSLQAFYRKRWPDFRLIPAEDERSGTTRVHSFVQHLKWRGEGFDPVRNKKEIPEEPTEGVNVALIEITNPPAEVREKFPVPVGKVFCSLSFINVRRFDAQ